MTQALVMYDLKCGIITMNPADRRFMDLIRVTCRSRRTF